MLFNSFAYAIFLPVIFVIYWILPSKYRWILILISSYYFYMSWNPKYVVLIFGTTMLSFIAALMVEKTNNPIWRKIVVGVTAIICLGVLFVFKYFNWFSNSCSSLLSYFSIYVSPASLNLLLPVGISFYTFQTLSYVIDVYRKDITAERNFGVYAAFISFFPQLVAGPIERAHNLLPQITSEKIIDSKNVEYGLKLITWGLFKKMCIADRLSAYVDIVYDSLETCSGYDILFAIIGFSIQIYCDFSGYSDIAIGSAKILGIDLMTNFSSPYFSASIKEFWSRWHISLSTWFKDYLYIPLGGNRCGTKRKAINLMVTFLISGLWHGASWTFVVWGGLHGFGQIIENSSNTVLKRIRANKVGHFFSVIGIFIYCSLAWVFFRAKTFKDAIYIVCNISKGLVNHCHFNVLCLGRYELWEMIFLCAILGLYDFINKKEDVIVWLSKKNVIVRWGVYLILIFEIFLFAKIGENSFIYFQF